MLHPVLLKAEASCPTTFCFYSVICSDTAIKVLAARIPPARSSPEHKPATSQAPGYVLASREELDDVRDAQRVVTQALDNSGPGQLDARKPSFFVGLDAPTHRRAPSPCAATERAPARPGRSRAASSALDADAGSTQLCARSPPGLSQR